MLALLLKLTLNLGFASSVAMADTSFVCPQDFTQYEGVTCCGLSSSQCRSLVEGEIPSSVIDGIHLFRRLFDQGYFFSGTTPNCHWNSLSFGRQHIQTFYEVDPYELTSYLKRSHELLPADAPLRKGDIVYFRFYPEEGMLIKARYSASLFFTSSVSTKNLAASGFFDHSAVYLGGGLIFQKENAQNRVFSIVDLERAHRSYEKDILESSGLSGQLVREIWRPL